MNEIKSIWKILWRYKFLLYNRTSLPILYKFNNIKVIDTIKFPLRGRNLNLFNLNLQLIKEAVKKPEKFIDFDLLTWRYLHYDIRNEEIYKKELWKYED